jgi:hypothetical protein
VEEASMIDQTISIERMASVRILYLGKIDSGEHQELACYGQFI